MFHGLFLALIVASVCVGCTVAQNVNGIHPTAEAIANEAVRQSKLAIVPLNEPRMVMDICASGPIPAGWIKVNDHWNPTSCGNPSSIVYNVITIERFNDKPIGSLMGVCAAAPTPNGWVDVDTRWEPTACGHPANIVHNMKTIRRVN